MVGGGNPLYLKFLVKVTALVRDIADFRFIFDRSASAVTLHGEKSSINTNGKSTTRFSMTPRGTSYVVSKLPSLRAAQKRRVPNCNSKVR